MRAAFILLALIPAIFAFGQASLRGCACTASYSGGGNAVTCIASCTNSGGQAIGSWTRNATTLTNTDQGPVQFFVSGTFTNNCPPSTASSGQGFQQAPVASWRIWRVDVTPNQVITGYGGSYSAGSYAMDSGVNGIVRNFPSGARFQLRATISPGLGTCTASFAGATLVVDQPAK